MDRDTQIILFVLEELIKDLQVKYNYLDRALKQEKQNKKPTLGYAIRLGRLEGIKVVLDRLILEKEMIERGDTNE